MKKSNRLIDVLAEEERKTFLTENILPKLEKLLNVIRVSKYESDARDEDYDFVTKLLSDMERRNHKITEYELGLCNDLWKKHK